MKELFDGAIDIALIRTDYLDEVDVFDCIPYKKDIFVLVCNQNHPLSTKEAVSLNDLIKYPLSLLDTSSVIYTIVMKAFERHGIEKKNKMSDNKATRSLWRSCRRRQIFRYCRSVSLT